MLRAIVPSGRRCLQTLATTPVQRIDASSLTPDVFLERYVRSPDPQPCFFAGERTGRANELLAILREQAGDVMVDAELSADAAYGQRTMKLPLALYLDWLTADATTLQRIGRPPYLAQSRLHELIPALAQAMPMPPYLAPHVDNTIDLYQLAHFLGPTGSTTPVHCDPFDNVLAVYAAADARDRKHVVLWPPDARNWLQDTDTPPVQSNLGTVAVDIEADGTVRAGLHKAGTPAALSCSLAEGDALWIPRKWWHAICNGSSDGVERTSWSAAIGTWTLPRS